MKKITKILIATGIVGIIGKIIHDKYDITFDFEMKKKNKVSDNIKQQYENDMRNEPDMKNTIEEPIGTFQEDRVYYDNPYNISIIHTYEGCPFAFTFENLNDWRRALKLFELLYFVTNNAGNKITVSEILESLGLIIDDYPEFKNHFACWTPEDFYEENLKCDVQNYLSFGTMEAPTSSK